MSSIVRNILCLLPLISLSVTLQAQAPPLMEAQSLDSYQLLLSHYFIPADSLELSPPKPEWAKKLQKDFGGTDFFFFTLPSIEEGKCLVGNCLEGKGKASYKDGRILYKGEFQQGFPHGRGAVYFMSNGFHLIGNFHTGYMDGQMLWPKSKGDTVRLYTMNGTPREVGNLYLEEYKVYYFGQVNAFLEPYGRGKVIGDGWNAEGEFKRGMFQGGTGEITASKLDIPELDLEPTMSYKGELDASFKPSGGRLSTPLGRISATFRCRNGVVDRSYVEIRDNEGAVYIGQVNKQYRPHGQGLLKKEGKEYNGGWRNGEFLGYASTGFNPDTDVAKGELEKLVHWAKKAFRATYPNSDIQYEGFAKEYITFQKRSTFEGAAHITILNLSRTKQDVCVKIKGMNDMCYTLPSSYSASGPSVTIRYTYQSSYPVSANIVADDLDLTYIIVH